jgi:fido (protein-threonine AMPylation protein)
MIIYELTGTENNPIYQELMIANGDRHYDFLRSIVIAAIKSQRVFLSQTVIKALNFHAIACLHSYAGEYRPCPVKVGDDFVPIEHYRVNALMDDFVNLTNRMWDTVDAIGLASFVLWRLNNIHPFINGNGRTARAAAYFVICLKLGGWPGGTTILPELIRANRDEYVAALKAADASAQAGNLDLSVLEALLTRLLQEQQATAQNAANNPSTPATPGAP